MQTTISEIIKSTNPPPVLLIFGDEDFLVEEALDALIEFAEKSTRETYELEMLNGSDISLDALSNLASAYPFITSRRMIIVRHFEELVSTTTSKKKVSSPAFTRYLDSPQPTTFLVCTASHDSLNGIGAEMRNAQKKAKAEKKIEGLKFPLNLMLLRHAWLEFPKIYESDLSGWLKSRLSKSGLEASAEAIELMIAHAPPELRSLNNEIGKLQAYLKDRKKVTGEDVLNVVGASRVWNVFELQKAVGERNLQKSLLILENMLAADRQEMLIITMLTRFFTVLWKLSDEPATGKNHFQLAGAVGINPYFVAEYLSALKKYKPEELDRAFIALAEADSQLKSTGGSSIMILQKMLLSIID
ncbi:MAG: polymerase subunit delta [Ignavibacteria bacterium]|nr:polymerase subunit delta [Ignavibacteria bacterium]